MVAALTAMARSRGLRAWRARPDHAPAVALCGANGFDGGDLPSGEARERASPDRHPYQVWIEGRLDPRYARALAGVAAHPISRFTVFAADLEPTGLYDLLGRLATIGAVIVAVGRDHAPVRLGPRGGLCPHDYEIRFAGRPAPAHFEDFTVTVHDDGAGHTRLAGRLDHSALHGILRLARGLDIELVALGRTR